MLQCILEQEIGRSVGRSSKTLSEIRIAKHCDVLIFMQEKAMESILIVSG